MYYDDSSRRLNLLSGLVFGAALGAGLALLFASDVPESGRRLVVRAARGAARTAREGAGAARGRLDAARERLSGDGERTTRVARKRFEL